MTPAQRADAIKRRRQIWEQLHPAAATVGQIAPPQNQHPKARPQAKAFAADTAEKTGEDKRNINKALHRADALGDDLQAVEGTALDKGVELDALAKMTRASLARWAWV